MVYQQELGLVKYMDSYKGSKKGIVDIVVDVAKAANIQIDINELREKYKLVNWTLKN